MFKTSDQTELLDLALAKAQGEIEGAKKDALNPHFKSKYADLASVYDACREALAKHEINVTQWPLHTEDQAIHIITRLAHKGQWMLAESSVPVVKNDAQGYGSSLTYIRRYALSAAVGVAPEDDDGNAAAKAAEEKRKAEAAAKTEANKKQAANVKPKNTAPGSITAQAKISLVSVAKEKGVDLHQWLEPALIDELSEAQAAQAWTELKDMK